MTRAVWIDGRPVPLKDLAARHGVGLSTLHRRLNRLGPDPDPTALTAPPMTKAQAGRLGKLHSPWNGTVMTDDPELKNLQRALDEAQERVRSLKSSMEKRRHRLAQELAARAKIDADRAKAGDVERRVIQTRVRLIE